MSTSDQGAQKPGTDSRVEDWFGQSANRDAELADEVTEVYGEGDAAEYEFERRATGRREQESRHGQSIDPDQGRSAYAGGGRDPGDPEAEHDPRVSTVPLDTDDGGQVVIEQEQLDDEARSDVSTRASEPQK